MTDKNLQDIALFRFSLIAPVVNDTYEASSLSAYFRVVASKDNTLPDGTSVRYSSGAIKKWYFANSLNPNLFKVVYIPLSTVTVA